MWLKEYAAILAAKSQIISFFDKHLTADTDVILTGAGTSAFIGDALVPVVRKGLFRNARACSTTDLITHAAGYLNPDRKVLLISFARSGNSPESVATVDIADKLCPNIAHVFITCNENGELARRAAGAENILLLQLPTETNDKSLAMTSSFSTMLLSALLISHINEIEAEKEAVEAIARNAQHILDHDLATIEEIAKREFGRGIFLGSGPLKGIAEECHLKLQELTDGGVVCKFDSFLGFRHGPKAVVNANSAVIYLVSDIEAVQRYERDLIQQVDEKNKLVAQVAVCCGKAVEVGNVHFDAAIVMPEDYTITKDYGVLPYVLVGQLLGFYKSIASGLCPDAPSVSGNIARVVEGVTIYN